MIKKTQKCRYPLENEVRFVRAMQIGFEGTMVPDEQLVAEFGSDALREVHTCWAPRVGWVHLACITSRAGHALMMMSTALPAKKGDLLMLFMPTQLCSPLPLLQRIQPNVYAVDFVVIDLDKGDGKFELVCEQLLKLFVAGLVYRSPSDGVTETKILR